MFDHFYHFWKHYCPDIRDIARAYLATHHRMVMYRRGEVIKVPDDYFPYLCIVLDGTVGGYQYNRSGKRSLRELLLPMDFFTGTEHTFSDRKASVEFVALRATTSLQITIADARKAQSLFFEVSELFHVLKQRKILRLRKLVALYQEDRYYDRYALFRELLPDVATTLTNGTQAELLHMSLGHLKKLKKRYVEEE
ncbi:hypothetical protein GCM10011386_33250 [Parapedobacter defluvii]|uniref:Cyclic nucleotide-binding domain-containing protein n=2 Tax=Parapedobacter defluvii TaxID=2045106 RepID=A0ABQ1MCY8_9SPHI|nr:hypothetical protein GCM10011386_33250 [Parapedobacter defluvii]